MTIPPGLAFYVAPLVASWGGYLWRRHRREAIAHRQRAYAEATGATEAISLHPLVDAAKCIGCKACIYACTEGGILGFAGNTAQVIAAANCIGHGACQKACPTGAISLVFGSETRGLELPVVDRNFETSVPGLFIAGELGGMGLIRNAIEQGRQAMDVIAARRSSSSRRDGYFDTIVVGAGPAGLAASLGALAHGLRSVTLEQDTLGGSIAHAPRGKVVMTAPADLPVVGRIHFRKVEKERLMAFWQDAVERSGLRINTNERVEKIEPVPGGFHVRTPRGMYATHTVLLAIGRRGTPQRLGVPGEELPKVAYRLQDPAQYSGKSVLVVGGGDSAVEAALSLADHGGIKVTLCHRGKGFARAKPQNRHRLDQAVRERRLGVLLEAEVAAIAPDHVVVVGRGREARVPNHAVIACIGGSLPDAFLKSFGITTVTHYGTA